MEPNSGWPTNPAPPIPEIMSGAAPLQVAKRPRFSLKAKVVGGILIFSGLSLSAVAISFAVANREINPPTDRKFEKAYLQELRAKQTFNETVFSYDYGGGIFSLQKPDDKEAALGQVAAAPGYLQTLRDDLAKVRSRQIDDGVANRENDCFKTYREVCSSLAISYLRTNRIVPVLGSMGTQKFFLTTVCNAPKTQGLVDSLESHLSGLKQIQLTLKGNPGAKSQFAWLNAQIADLTRQVKTAKLELGSKECQEIPKQLILAMAAIDTSAWLETSNPVVANNLSIDPTGLVQATAAVLDASVVRLRATNHLDAAAELEQLVQQRQEFRNARPTP